MTLTKSTLAALICSAFFAAGSVCAAPPAPPKPEPGTAVTLPVTASVEVQNDRAVVQLYVLENNADVSAASKAVIEKAAEGLRALKALYPQAEMKTVSLTTNPRYTKPKEGEAAKIASWDVRQTVSVALDDVKLAAPFVQAAQKYFAFDHVGFELSSKARASVQDQLVRDVIADMKEQAGVIAETIAGKRARIRYESIEFHNAAYVRPMNYRVQADGMMLKAAAAAPETMPVFDAGSTTLTRSLTAKLRIETPKAKPPRPDRPRGEPRPPRPEPVNNAPAAP